MTIQFTFKPVAQNTIIRPLAQAVCIMHGGKKTDYIDPTDKQKKSITPKDLWTISLEITKNGKPVTIDGGLAAFQALHYSAEMKVEINDIPVVITPDTTVTEAMAQFRKKYNQRNKKFLRHLPQSNLQKD